MKVCIGGINKSICQRKEWHNFIYLFFVLLVEISDLCRLVSLQNFPLFFPKFKKKRERKVLRNEGKIDIANERKV